MSGGVRAVVRHRTTIVPHRPVATLVTTGAYRVSRNPMYTGLAAPSQRHFDAVTRGAPAPTFAT